MHIALSVLNEPYEQLDQFSKMIISETVTSVRELPKKRDQVFYELILASVRWQLTLPCPLLKVVNLVFMRFSFPFFLSLQIEFEMGRMLGSQAGVT